MKIPSGIIAIATLAVLAAVIATLALGSFTAQAQEPAGSINNQLVSSPDPGQLVVTWSAPTETPTDYRVRWAPANQDYLSYSVENTSERGSAYPEATTLTVDNLPTGTEYKVQVRARYYQGQHQDNPWSSPWSEEATVTISSPPPPPTTTPDPTSEPTQEPTPATDAVTDLALSSDTAGELAITWSQPTDQPTDYRISWTPTDESYPSYSAENNSRRGNSYPDGNTTSLTLTGLPGSVNYKVIMRARYEDGSGPWSDEVTQRILNSPPAAPTGLNATEVSDSSITLSWTAPSSAGITGYRVLRGLTAAKQDVLENDTGSTETEYLDSDVQAGTEYHYSVRAINDAGVSPSSNSIAVTAGDDQTIVVRQGNVGTVTFSPTQPDLGIPITASVTDADTPVTEETWQWSKSDTATGTFADITDATSATYRPAEADLEKFLKASVTYTDSQAAGNTSSAVASTAVQVRDTILVDNVSDVEIAHGNPGLSQGLTTGGHPEGYKISGVTISTTSSQSSLVVKIFSSTSNANHPDSAAASELYKLTYRSKRGSYSQTWDLPTGTRLDPNTAYHVVLLPANGRSGITCLGPASATSSGATDWSLISTIRSTTATGGHQPTIISGTCSLRIRGEAAKDGPHITDLSYSTEPTQTRTYDTGDTIKVAATFSEAVTVSTTNPPTLPLKIGSETRSATYVSSESTTTKLVFSYAVVAGDQDNDGITIEQNSLTGGITRLSSTVAADLDHAADNNNTDRLVNAVPTVTEVRITSSPVAPNWYTTGETIEITVTFSIPITVEGDPHFEFSLDQADTPADYAASASETNTMVFQYTVLATDEDTNGIWIGDQSRTFKLDSDDFIKDSLRTTGQKAAVLTHSGLSTQGSHRISPLPRLALSVTSDPRSGSRSDTYGVGEMIEFTATFNQDITVTGDPQHAFSLLDDGGDTATERRVADYQASLSGTRTAVFTYTVVAADRDNNGIFLWGHGGGNTSFDLDSDDTIQNSANTDAVLDYPRHRTQSGHKVDGSKTPPISVPFFPDTDNDNIADPIALTIDENSAAGTVVGTVVATDTDGDRLTYTVSGTDNLIFARTFDYNTSTGAITVKTGARLDHEVKASYSISVAVTDGETTLGVPETGTPTPDDTVAVTITVTDVAETEIVALSYPDPWTGVVLIAGLDGDDVTDLTWSWERSTTGTSTWIAMAGTVANGGNQTTSYTTLSTDAYYFIRATATYKENGVEATATAKTTASVIPKPVCESPANILGTALGGAGYPADIWSDGRTIWVSMFQNNAVNPELKHPILTFDLCAGTRLSAVPPFYLGNNAGNEELRSMWAEGPTMWALRDENDRILYGYSMHPTRGWVHDSNYTFSGSLGTNEVHDVWVVNGIMYAGRDGWHRADDFAMILAYNWASRPTGGGALSQNTDRDYQNSDAPGGATNYRSFLQIVSDGKFLWMQRGTRSPKSIGALRLGTSGAPVRTPAKDIPWTTPGVVAFGMWANDKHIWTTAGNLDSYHANTGIYTTTIINAGPYFPDTDSDDTPDPVEFTLAENALADAELGTVTATDPEDDTITYSVGGTDATAFAEAFQLNTANGKITVKTGSNMSFEAKPSYSINIEATDGKDAAGNGEITPTIDGSVAVTITVTDVEEDGSITLSRATPAVGITVTATLTDPDGGETTVTWQWAKSDTENGSFSNITTATSDSYTPVTADVGKWLKVTASYTDRRGPSKTATKTADNAVDTSPHKVPAFATDTQTLTVAENAPGDTTVGTVSTTDTDGDDLVYTFGGTDGTAFDDDFILDTNSGEIKVKTNNSIDYEDRTTYTITISVSDGEDASGVTENPAMIDDSITVTINVTNVDEAGTVTLSAATPQVYVEQTASVTDIDGAVTDLTWQWSKSDTADGTFTNISGATSAAYTPQPADQEQVLKAKASYTDPEGSGKERRGGRHQPGGRVPPHVAGLPQRRRDLNGS